MRKQFTTWQIALVFAKGALLLVAAAIMLTLGSTNPTGDRVEYNIIAVVGAVALVIGAAVIMAAFAREFFQQQ